MILHISILTVLLCYTMMFYYVIIVVCSRTSYETAFGWWVNLGKYVLIKNKKIKEQDNFSCQKAIYINTIFIYILHLKNCNFHGIV